ncbi:hypothetical protein RQP46_000346 [Phenoliferia psychrophenolica]
MLGYGQTSRPTDISKYTYKAIAYDLDQILVECGVPGKVVMVGHDWGGMSAWRFVDYFPHRVIAIASVCTPYQAPATDKTPIVPDEVFIRKYAPNFGYQLWLCDAGAAEELDEVLDQFLQPMHSPMYRKQRAQREDGKMSNWVKEGHLQTSIRRQIEARKAGQLPPAPAERELDYYLSQYRLGGIGPALNWYRTRALNIADEKADRLPAFPSHIPALHIPAELDAALPPSMGLLPSVLSRFPAGNLEVKILSGGDHWCLQDDKVRGVVTETLCDWIERVLAGKWRPTEGVTTSKL